MEREAGSGKNSETIAGADLGIADAQGHPCDVGVVKRHLVTEFLMTQAEARGRRALVGCLSHLGHESGTFMAFAKENSDNIPIMRPM